MKTRNAFATVTICVLSALTIPELVNLRQVEAQPIQPIKDCRRLVTGTYLTTISSDFGSFRGLVTFNQDGNFVATGPIQSSLTNIPSSSSSNTQGSWKCISDREITATGLFFNYPTATLPSLIIRTDFRATFDPEAGIVQATTTLRAFDLNANPLNDDAPVAGTLTFTGQRITPGQ